MGSGSTLRSAKARKALVFRHHEEIGNLRHRVRVLEASLAAIGGVLAELGHEELLDQQLDQRGLKRSKPGEEGEEAQEPEGPKVVAPPEPSGLVGLDGAPLA